MTSSVPGITLQKLVVEGEETPAMLFLHSRKKQVLGLIVFLAFTLSFVSMFFSSETAKWPVIGVSPGVTQVLAVTGGLFMGCMAALAIKVLLSPQTYIALLPTGVLSPGAKPPLFISWNDMEEVSIFGSGAQRAIGIRIKNAGSIESLQPFRKRMESGRSFSGWDWGFGSNAYDVRREVLETAFQHFYYTPEKRSEIGTAAGLASVQEAVAQGWKKSSITAPLPEPDAATVVRVKDISEEDRQQAPAYLEAHRKTIDDYRNRFRTSLTGRWSHAVGTFNCVMDEIWEFNPDHTGKVTETGPFYAEQGETLFEWKEVTDFTIACKVIRWSYEEDEDVSEGEVSEETESGWWDTIRYDFTLEPTDCGEMVALREVSDDGTLQKGFWLSMQPLTNNDEW